MTVTEIIPLPKSMGASGTLRGLRDGVLRVRTAPSSMIEAASAVSSAAFGIVIVVVDEDADVVLRYDDAGTSAPTGADPRPADRRGESEAYRIRVEEDGLLLTAASGEGAFRGLLTIVGAVTDGTLPALHVDDHPDHGWRGLSLDVVRRWFPVEEVTRIIDLLAVHKMNVLHLHLTDSQAWRFEVPDHPGVAAPGESYSLKDLSVLEDYARARYVTIVPEIDVPGHVAASLVEVDGIEVVEGDHPFVRYLTWGGAGVAGFVRDGFAVLAEHFASPYLHLGGDEAFGAPHDEYVRFVRASAEVIRGLGRTPLGWQEAVRADALGDRDLVQLWIAERDRFDLDKAKRTFPEEYHPLLTQAAELFALSVEDAALIGAAGIPTIVSSSDPLYLDRRTSDSSRDRAQDDVWARLGNPGYDATSTTSVLEWSPSTQEDIVDAGVRVAGIEAALWCETVRDFDDVATLLLPRLALIAQRAWDESADRKNVIAAAAAQASVWERLGFESYYRSVEVFGA
jgi:hexosaminidase